MLFEKISATMLDMPINLAPSLPIVGVHFIEAMYQHNIPTVAKR
jgi:hypothetical protein